MTRNIFRNIVRTSGVAENDKDKKGLNKREKKDKLMLEITKKDYDDLKYYADNTKSKIGYSTQRKWEKVDKEVQERLIKLGWIDIDPNSQKLHNPDFFVTKEGNEKVIELEKLRHEDYKLWIAIAAVVVSTLILAKAEGWW